MQKLRFFLLLLMYPSILFAQEQRTRIILEKSTSLTVDTKTNINYVKNPTFRHDNATLTCDSAVFYKDRNYFEAYRNVHINQGDTVNIYSDFLNYDGNKKLAHLSSNVRLVDLTSTLTTNILDYDMGLKYGTYLNGGKIVNKDVVLTSKRGYYFANTKDAYFRYNVVVVTPQSTVKSDTLRYNTLTNWTYFYGPTNIKGKDDNLYTEDGAYNTKTENAYFGRKNLYTEGTKSLKGDSLYYNGKTGYGKAVRNIVFKDTSDKTLLRGQLGEYYKFDERVIVTKQAYFAMATKDSIKIAGKMMPDTLWLGADTLEAQKTLQKNLVILKKPIVKKDNEIGKDDEKAKLEKEKEKSEARKEAAKVKTDTKATLNQPKDKKSSKKDKKQAKDFTNEPPQVKIDSIKLLRSKFVTDSLRKDSVVIVQKKIADSVTNAKKVAVKANNTLKDSKIPSKTPALKTALKKDSVIAFNPADTVRTRVIKAYHDVRVFKSNMQARADSLFYTAADSVLRWYKNPILWSQGSQQTGDTIYVFFKNEKIHSFQVLKNSFAVNAETDTTKFNQAKGTTTTGFFEDGNLKNMFIDGNAESIYFDKDDKNVYKNMNQTASSRIKFTFVDKELAKVTMFREIEGRTDPIEKLPKETLLTGFIWKPELRPVSKADIIKGKPVKKSSTKNSKAPAKTSSAQKKDSKGIKPILPAKKTTEKPKEALKTTPMLDKPKEADSLKADTTVKKPVIIK